MFRVNLLFSWLKVLWPALILLAVGARFLRNYYKLNHIPGPFLAGFTDAWRFIHCFRGQSYRQYELHRKYDSHLVRLGPNTVSVSDATAIPIIYGLKPIFNKGHLYVTHQFMSEKGEVMHNLSSTRDEGIHAALRRPVNHAYALTNLLGYEKLMDRTTDFFFMQLNDRFVATGAEVDLATWLQMYAFDVIGEITFSKRFGFLEAGYDLENMLKHTAAHMDYLGTMGQLPDLDEYFRLRNWFSRKFRTVNAIVTFSANQIAQHSHYTDPDTPPDFISRFQATVEKYPNVMTPAQMIDYAATNVSAGSDTTAIILREIIFRLLIDQSGRFDVFMNEIKAVLRARSEEGFDDHISWNEGYKMTYLQACIKETMRIHPALGQILPRVVPAGGIHLCNKFIPAGTEVGCNAWTVHRDRAVFGDDVDDWVPERWLVTDEQKVKNMERYNFVFGGGSRTCIGRHVAMLELSKLVPDFFRAYEVELIDPSRYKDNCKWLVVQTGLDVKLRLRDQKRWLSETP